MSASPKKPAKSRQAAAPQRPAATYAELQAQLDHILTELQRDDLDVDAALAYYQQGMELVSRLEEYLKTTQNKITELKAKSDAAG